MVCEGWATSACVKSRPTDVVALPRKVMGTGSGQRATPTGVRDFGDRADRQLGAGRLERIVSNLLENALKYSPRGAVSRTAPDPGHQRSRDLCRLVLQDHAANPAARFRSHAAIVARRA